MNRACVQDKEPLSARLEIARSVDRRKMRSALLFCLCMPAAAAFSVGVPIGMTRAVQLPPMSRLPTAGLTMSEGPVVNRQGLWGQGEAPECC